MCLKAIETDNRTFLAGYESGEIVLWDLETLNIVSKLCAHKEPGNKSFTSLL